MPGFGDSAFIVLLALLLFGPKKLPVLARQLGKLMADFRRASNEFRAQMEEELRISEQADRQKELAALEASASSSTTINAATQAREPHTPPPAPNFASPAESSSGDEYASTAEIVADSPTEFTASDDTRYPETSPVSVSETSLVSAADPQPTPSEPAPLPIATSGELSIMPPATGLPLAKSAQPALDESHHEAELETETLHG
jgi:sec-independent protein translocase protein TatB